MLLWFVIGYWAISVAIGLIVALRVRNTVDYAAAGHRMPLYVVTATVFATWFGSETVLGIPATFLKEGLRGVVADPFGSSLCLVLVGLFFARPLYRRKLLTIGDFYRRQYGRTVEVLVTLCIVLSYLGWVAAQIKALGLVFNVVSDGSMSKPTGMIVGAATVMVYTLFGGMLSVAITDFIQMIIIMLGMVYIGWDLGGPAGGIGAVVHQAAAQGKLSFWPAPHWGEVIAFFTAWITMMLGSIPQQDVFQRVTSSDTEITARNASILGGGVVFPVCLHSHVPGLFGDAYRSGAGQSLSGQRFPTDPSRVDSDSFSKICPDHVLRGAVVGHQELCLGHLAGTLRDFFRKHPAGIHAGDDRPAIADGDALGGVLLYLPGDDHRPQFAGVHLQHGGGCL